VSSYRCPVCGYVYDEAKDAPREGFSAGTPFSDVPDKVDFELMEVRS
jgi:rubredoxin